MSITKDLQRSIKTFLKQHRQGSFATQASREQILLRFAADLVAQGYRLSHIQGLKPKHIQAVVAYWQSQSLAISTVKNRLSVLRNLCATLNKANIVLSNPQLNIGRRQYVPLKNRAIIAPDFSKIRHPAIYISLQLQRVFGLRREEALKIQPHLADQNTELKLLPSWCKGGRGRFIPIRTEEQRYWLEQAKQLVRQPGYSMIPSDKSYIQHRHVYDKQVNRAGLRNLHGLRHAYAQQRYQELTGWLAPIAGGPKSRELTPEQKQLDYQARMILTEELGHSREQITVNYCGR